MTLRSLLSLPLAVAFVSSCVPAGLHRALPLHSLDEQELLVRNAEGLIAYAAEAHSLDVVSFLEAPGVEVGDPVCWSSSHCGSTSSHALRVTTGAEETEVEPGASAEVAGGSVLHASSQRGVEINSQCLDYVPGHVVFAVVGE